MYRIDQEHFSTLVTKAIDLLPARYRDNLHNVAFFVEREPTIAQRDKLRLRDCDLLFGLYEGIPLTARGSGYNLVLPDTITIFQDAIELVSTDEHTLWEQIRRTVWHEVAHYYGLEHDHMERLIRKSLA